MSSICEVCGCSISRCSLIMYPVFITFIKCSQCNRYSCDDCLMNIKKIRDDQYFLYRLDLLNKIYCNECLEDDNPNVTRRPVYRIIKDNFEVEKTHMLEEITQDVSLHTLRECFEFVRKNKLIDIENDEELVEYLKQMIADKPKGASSKA